MKRNTAMRWAAVITMVIIMIGILTGVSTAGEQASVAAEAGHTGMSSLAKMVMSAVFMLGYLLIATEHLTKLDKGATALLTGVFCWLIFVWGGGAHGDALHHELAHHGWDIFQILVFLLGAMTIVEMISLHGGFNIVTKKLKTKSKRGLLWKVGFISFFLSAILDNMTTAIVMASVVSKILQDKEDKLIFAGMIIIAANAGGAWSPMGDVTTTMLWIAGCISATKIISHTLLPSLVSLIIPLIYQSFIMKGEIEEVEVNGAPERGAGVILAVGLGGLMSVPLLKVATGLPPYLCMMGALGVLWVVAEIIHKGHAHLTPEDAESHGHNNKLSVAKALSRVEMPSLLFFIGILQAVGALQSAGLLEALAGWLDAHVGNLEVITTILGMISSVLDNVPLTAGAMKMYTLERYPMDHEFWLMLAYCVGTGGSLLVIGSAAGVVLMGMLKIEFFWYLKKITFTAILGYFAGAITLAGIFHILG